jgi:hypothetical protein
MFFPQTSEVCFLESSKYSGNNWSICKYICKIKSHSHNPGM